MNGLIALHSERDAVPDVPAVYFCLPSEENLERINRDLESGLYGRFFFNFISPIPRQKLEDLATFALQNNVVAQVRKKYYELYFYLRTLLIWYPKGSVSQFLNFKID